MPHLSVYKSHHDEIFPLSLEITKEEEGPLPAYNKV